jgi:hypothetical protein
VRSSRQNLTGSGVRRSRPTPSAGGAVSTVDAVIASIADLEPEQLRLQWRNHLGGTPPAHLPRWLLARVLARRIQIAVFGDLRKSAQRVIWPTNGTRDGEANSRSFVRRDPETRAGVALRPGAVLVREWKGALQRVMVMEDGFAWNGETYRSLSQVAKAMTGTSWNGHRFFGLKRADYGVGAERNPKVRAPWDVVPGRRSENKAPLNRVARSS